jgi:hypothetical protein
MKEFLKGSGKIALWSLVGLIGYWLISYLDKDNRIWAYLVLGAIALRYESNTTYVHKPPKPKKKFINSLVRGGPITPKHEAPKDIGGEYKSLVDEDDRRLFSDFREFADVVNAWLADEHVGGPWRLQELPTTEITLTRSDSPRFGRCYSVFHNQVKVGRLEISRGYPYSTDAPNIWACIELGYVRLLSFDAIEEFLTYIAWHVSSEDTKSNEYLSARQGIQRALTQAIWATQRITEFEEFDGQDWGEVALSFSGTAPWYFHKRNLLRESDSLEESEPSDPARYVLVGE